MFANYSINGLVQKLHVQKGRARGKSKLDQAYKIELLSLQSLRYTNLEQKIVKRRSESIGIRIKIGSIRIVH